MKHAQRWLLRHESSSHLGAGRSLDPIITGDVAETGSESQFGFGRNHLVRSTSKLLGTGGGRNKSDAVAFWRVGANTCGQPSDIIHNRTIGFVRERPKCRYIISLAEN